MKTLKLFLILMVIGFTTNAQITLEQTYPNGNANHIMMIRLANSGKKYVEIDKTNNKIILYHLNHSVYKTIKIPYQDTVGSGYNIDLISETLFNSDAKIEYLLSAWNKKTYAKIYNEDSTLLFYENGYSFGAVNGVPSIFNTDSGTKMILYNPSPFIMSARVYGLAGTYVAMKVAPVDETNNGTGILAYPNPATNEMKIEYELPNGTERGTIFIYDLTGKLLSKYDVTNSFKDVSIDTPVRSGVYLYQLKADGKILATKKFVVQ